MNKRLTERFISFKTGVYWAALLAALLTLPTVSFAKKKPFEVLERIRSVF